VKAGDRLALLTSGGDAPGMNAALRAALRVGRALGLEVLGVEEGYRGLMEGRIAPLELRAVDDSARRGGTLLGTSRAPIFVSAEGQAAAKKHIDAFGLSAVMVIGGNGSLTGAQKLMELGVNVGGLPASIDNDLGGTSIAIGVDTAMNTIVDACDRICDTASAHRRTFIVEVMGRDCGYLAMTAAIAACADAVLVPEVGRSEEEIVEQICRTMRVAYQKDSDKRRILVVKSEGVKFDATHLKRAVDERMQKEFPDVDSRVTVLGHVVRGGAPSAFDRMLAARLANTAVRALYDGHSGFMTGWVGPSVHHTPSTYDPHVALVPLSEVLAETKKLMQGDSAYARWRKKAVEEVEAILAL
jgi:6-phosphofructokinase 1